MIPGGPLVQGDHAVNSLHTYTFSHANHFYAMQGVLQLICISIHTISKIIIIIVKDCVAEDRQPKSLKFLMTENSQ